MLDCKSQYRNQCIDNYLINGHALFPISQNKVPLIKQWNRLQPDLLQPIDLLHPAYGVILTATDCVIDFDPRRGQEQLTKLIKLLQLEIPINTFIVRTMGGGIHMYFKKSPTLKVPSSHLKQFNAIEIKTHGRFVVGAGSTINGKTYKVIRGSLNALLTL